MFSTVVIGIDGRQQDDEAFALATQLADPGARFIAANVAGRGPGLVRPGTPVTAGDLLTARRALVDRFVERHDACTGVVAVSVSVGRGLEHVAQREGADLVVVASSRRGLPGRAFAGEAVWDVLAHTHCPVAVAAVGQHHGHQLKHLVVGLDGSEASRAGVRHAVHLARREHAELTAVAVIDPVAPVTAVPGVFVDGKLHGARELAHASLDAVAREYGIHGVVAVGDAAAELADASADSDLLVVGCSEQGFLRRLLAGSTTRTLARNHSSPVLFAHASDRTSPAAEARARALAEDGHQVSPTS